MTGSREPMAEERYLQVQTTTESEADARRIGETLVRERLAACAQLVGPISSIYRWRGALSEAREWLCLLKTTDDRYPLLEARIRELHPYEEPEIVALPVAAGSAGYLAWVIDSTRPGGD